MQRELMRGRAGMRAWGYEKRLEEGKGGEIARRCWMEMRNRARRGKEVGKWEEERRRFFEDRGWKIDEIEERREKGEGLRGEEIKSRERRKQEEERWERIRESRHNEGYGKVKGKGVPGYLKMGWEEKRWRRIARFRLGCELRGGRYWEEEEKRRCRMCGRREETWKHIWEECTGWGEERGWQEMEREVGEEGKGEKWMKEVEKWWRGEEEGGGGKEGGGRRRRREIEGAPETEVME
ncbi:hypothetical protein EAI_03061 [Harpegnathos saltator]|uniref:Uncharacterized protein n=1 Tax=Harpegnathos saltator TaxID=610380 RepID=E2C854_HARSA|nr:hypothetical protein EAI_03061 [Harpegnathos saltator]